MLKLNQAEIEFIAKDLVSNVVKKIEDNIDGMEKQNKKSSSEMETSWSRFGRILETTAGVAIANLATMMGSEVVKAFKQGIGEALLFEEQMIALNQQVDNSGEFLDSLRKSTNGLVNDLSLLKSANRALAFGLEQESVPALAETAVALGKLQGLSPDQAFNDIVTGIARASPMILDNLGIVIDAETTYNKYAEAIGKTAEQLTKTERLLALQNQVIENSRIQVLKNVIAQTTLKDRLTQFRTELENTRREIAGGTLGFFEKLEVANRKNADIDLRAIEILKEKTGMTLQEAEATRRLNEYYDIRNDLTKEIVEGDKKFEEGLKELNSALDSNLDTLKELGNQLDDYKDKLDETRKSFSAFLNMKTDEQIANDKELLKLKRDQLVIEDALQKAGLSGFEFDVLAPKYKKQVQDFIDEYNKANGTNITYQEDINEQIKTRTAELEKQNQLFDVEKQLFNLEKEGEIYKAINGEELDRADNFADYKSKFDTYVKQDIPNLKQKIGDVQTQIDNLNSVSETMLQNFADAAKEWQVSYFYANQLKGIIDSYSGASVKVDYTVFYPQNNLQSRFG